MSGTAGWALTADTTKPNTAEVTPHHWSGRLRTLALWLLAVFFTLAGLNHFLNPGPYLGLMPAYLPWHRELILVSGAAEMAGGLAVLVPRLRTLAG